MDQGDLGGAVLTIVIIIIILLVATSMFSQLSQTQPGTDESVTREAALLDGTSFTTLRSGIGRGETAYETTGYGVNLTGASDSYVRAKSNFEIAEDQTWTVSAWGYVEQGSGSDDMGLVSADGRVTISYNGSASQWEAWYYDEGARNSYQVNVSASGNEVGNYTNVMVRANGTHFTIYRNNTQGEIVNITLSSITDAPVNATNWNGRIEEIRTFDDALTSSERSSLVSSPAEELPAPNVTARAMFDQPDRSTQLLLYTGTSLDQSNASFSQGFAEQIMSAQGVLGGGDYEWDNNGPKIRALSGGDLDGAPVVYASYEYDGDTSFMVDAWNDTVGLAALLPILILLGVIWFYFGAIRTGR